MPIVRKESKQDPQLRWFDDARFGMFVHFGLYALLGRGEWVMYHEKIPRSEYEKLMHRFNPRRFDADTWVALARDAGARYITVTAKHHDGFCLFDSQLTDYKITNTPFGRDLIGELIAACHRRGMRIILYYSQPDWHHPNYVHLPGAFKDLDNPPDTDEPDWPKFQEYIEGQVLELVTRYGRIDGIFFDGSHKSEKTWRGRRLYQLIKKHQPHAVVNDRARYGDYFTPERSLPDDLTGYLFEACQAATKGAWGYDPRAECYSAPYLIESLVRMATAGGNYLLNVGPAPDGTIPRDQAERMRAIGRWMKRHGQAIYGTSECRVDTGSDAIRTTRRGNDLYLFLLRWPQTGRLTLPGILSLPAQVRLIGGKPLQGTVADSGELCIDGLPASPTEPSVHVLHLRFSRAPRLRWTPPARPDVRKIHLDPRTVNRLPAEAADLGGRWVKGGRLRVVPVDPKSPAGSLRFSSRIDAWHGTEQYAVWHVQAPTPIRCRVRVRLSCPALYAGSTFIVQCGGERLRGQVEGTASWDDYRSQDIGVISLPRGEARIILRPTHMPYGYLFARVQGLELARV